MKEFCELGTALRTTRAATTFCSGFLLLSVCLLGGNVLQAQEKTQTARPLIRFSPTIPTAALSALPAEPEIVRFNQLPQTLQDLEKLEQTTLKLVPRYQTVTVGIQVGQGQGSGVVVSPQGHILTAAHVVGEVGARVTIVFQDGRRHRARVAGVDAAADAAIVRLEGKGPYEYVPMAENEFSQKGGWVLSLGHPNGYFVDRQPVVRLGRVIQCTDKTVQSDCSLVGGDSGGPLFDLEGRVVGIHSRIGINNSINFHVPIQIYLQDWDELNAGYTPDPAVDPLPREQKAYLGIRGRDAATTGCQITEVTPNGPAAQAGLQRGDIITRCDGKAVKTFPQLVGILKGKKPEDELEIELQRGGKRETVTVVLAGTEI